MNEITPELIAQIATRLYNEIPGAGQVPENGGRRAGDGAAGHGLAGELSGAADRGNPAPVAAEASPPVRFFPFPPRREDPVTADGLHAFVQRVRATSPASADGRCGDGQDRRLFAAAAGRCGAGHRAPPPLDVPAIRRDFPILHQHVHGKPLVWLDNAATTQKPQSVIDALAHFYAHDNSNIHRGAHTLAARATDAFEQARQKVQLFLGASSANEIVFVRGTTEGINLVGQTYGRKFLQPGDEIVLSTLEHHANIVPWQMIAKEKGAVLRIIPVTDRGEIMLEEYERLLGPKPKWWPSRRPPTAWARSCRWPK